MLKFGKQKTSKIRHGKQDTNNQQVVVVGFGHLQPATWSYHAADCQPTALVPSVLLVLPDGTLYRTI